MAVLTEAGPLALKQNANINNVNVPAQKTVCRKPCTLSARAPQSVEWRALPGPSTAVFAETIPKQFEQHCTYLLCNKFEVNFVKTIRSNAYTLYSIIIPHQSIIDALTITFWLQMTRY